MLSGNQDSSLPLTGGVSSFKLTFEMGSTFGDKVRELREKADLSLRALARKLDVSAPFLSDVELGRRYPSEPVMQKIAEEFGVRVEELKKYDSRPPIDELRRLAEDNPEFGFAFRTMFDEHKRGKISEEELLNRIRGKRSKR